jgi:hypothetical protein
MSTTSALDTTSVTSPPETPSCMEVPPPTKEHQWLRRFEGDWDSEIEIYIAPNQPPIKSKGVDHAYLLGGFWLISEGRNLEMDYECRLALSYDSSKQRYIGTWLDTMSSYLWHYTGTVDASGQVLTLETEGPFPPGADVGLTKFREVTEFKSDDHRVFTSSRQSATGEWISCVTINFYRRK